MEINYVYPRYQTLDARIRSFPYTFRILTQAYHNFAIAGFFFHNNSGQPVSFDLSAITFCCGKNYKLGDCFIDPWKLHETLEPDCPFLTQYKHNPQ